MRTFAIRKLERIHQTNKLYHRQWWDTVPTILRRTMCGQITQFTPNEATGGGSTGLHKRAFAPF